MSDEGIEVTYTEASTAPLLLDIVKRLAKLRRVDVVEMDGDDWVCRLCNTEVNTPTVAAHDPSCPWRLAREFVASAAVSLLKPESGD